MKRTSILLLSMAFFAFACNNSKKKISVDIEIERFDKDFFAIDSNNIVAGISRLNQKYPGLTTVYLQNVLGLDSASMVPGVQLFLQRSRNLTDDVNKIFSTTNSTASDFENAFGNVKLHFAQYQVPRIISIVGPIDALAQGTYGPNPCFLYPGFLGISLQFYLGRDFTVYNDPFFIENVAPAYRSRRFSKEYIIADAMQLIALDLFPDNSGGKPLVEQMIERGKRWWLLDQFLPDHPDSVKTGYTQQQLDWCNENEGNIWSQIIRSEDLYSVNPVTIQTYIGEGPFTQGFSQEFSPGNLGQWIGWQIVKKFVEKNSDMKAEQVMNTPAKKILDLAKYKPK